MLPRQKKPIARFVLDGAASKDAVQSAVRGVRQLQKAIRPRNGATTPDARSGGA